MAAKLMNDIFLFKGALERADQNYEEEWEMLWRELATKVNTYGCDPQSLVAEELRKYGLYFEARVAA